MFIQRKPILFVQKDKKYDNNLKSFALLSKLNAAQRICIFSVLASLFRTGVPLAIPSHAFKPLHPISIITLKDTLVFQWSSSCISPPTGKLIIDNWNTSKVLLHFVEVESCTSVTISCGNILSVKWKTKTFHRKELIWNF